MTDCYTNYNKCFKGITAINIINGLVNDVPEGETIDISIDIPMQPSKNINDKFVYVKDQKQLINETTIIELYSDNAISNFIKLHIIDNGDQDVITLRFKSMNTPDIYDVDILNGYYIYCKIPTKYVKPIKHTIALYGGSMYVCVPTPINGIETINIADNCTIYINADYKIIVKLDDKYIYQNYTLISHIIYSKDQEKGFDSKFARYDNMNKGLDEMVDTITNFNPRARSIPNLACNVTMFAKIGDVLEHNRIQEISAKDIPCDTLLVNEDVYNKLKSCDQPIYAFDIVSIDGSLDDWIYYFNDEDYLSYYKNHEEQDLWCGLYLDSSDEKAHAYIMYTPSYDIQRWMYYDDGATDWCLEIALVHTPDDKFDSVYRIESMNLEEYGFGQVDSIYRLNITGFNSECKGELAGPYKQYRST